ncbi:MULTISPECIES: outer membrane lipoprotein chaperone LolA [unclassified Moraxella]|uniref:outer membrane lipoprotein chaperone LolA n=1 Tax=unclassified Moraxella TaxID=2685852 RepID=UPI002B40C9BF|nr:MULTISPECIES: outer membrane lipoprotein chaperone LolA [unclassified Moraxella]
MSKFGITKALGLKQFLSTSLVLVTTLLALPATAQSDSQQMAVKNLNSLLSATNSMTANFTQTTKAGKKTTNFSGVMAVQRYDQFRWETKSPANQLIIANNAVMWVYDPDLGQAIKQPIANQIGDTPAILLSGNPDKIADSFHITQPNSAKNYFKLMPKSANAGFSELYISFYDDKPVQIIVLDLSGQQTTVKFSNISINKKINASQFDFSVPKGTQVISQ